VGPIDAVTGWSRDIDSDSKNLMWWEFLTRGSISANVVKRAIYMGKDLDKFSFRNNYPSNFERARPK
jgi:hypothetical protein